MSKKLKELKRIYPRVFKLINKGENFIVIAQHEPYFAKAYALIREQEKKQGTWSFADEILFQVAVVISFFKVS